MNTFRPKKSQSNRKKIALLGYAMLCLALFAHILRCSGPLDFSQRLPHATRSTTLSITLSGCHALRSRTDPRTAMAIRCNSWLSDQGLDQRCKPVREMSHGNWDTESCVGGGSKTVEVSSFRLALLVGQSCH